MPRKQKNRANRGLNQQHAGGHYGSNSSHGRIMHARSAPYLKKEQVVLSDVIVVPSNANLADDAQIVRVGPNGLKFFGTGGTAKPQSALWAQYAEMYEFYQVDGFSCRWIPNKFEFQTGGTGNTNQPLIASSSFSCLDPEDEFPQTPSAILAYNTSKIAGPYCELHNSVPNYKGLSIQKQEKTILKTGDGVIGNEETYVDAAGFVTYVINPWRGSTNPSRYLGWMQFTCTYTFSGLKRPGAALSKDNTNGPQSTVPQAPTVVGNPMPLPVQPQQERPADVTLSMSQFERILSKSTIAKD